MPHFKFGYWMRVEITAPTLEDTDRVRLNKHPTNLDGWITVDAGDTEVRVNDIELEWEHTSCFDDEGREIKRIDGEGEIEPSFTSENGNFYS